jgi:hypothetical protein
MGSRVHTTNEYGALKRTESLLFISQALLCGKAQQIRVVVGCKPCIYLRNACMASSITIFVPLRVSQKMKQIYNKHQFYN